jgi:integrase
LTVGEPKTPSSFRVIPIPSFLSPLLLEHKKKTCSEWVVAINDYGIPDPRSYQYKYKKILENCSVPYKNFHSCRHTFASRCIEVGVDIKSLSEMLGHASVNITLDTYVHSSLDQKRSQIELLGINRGQNKGHKTA